jgi:predicted phosphodiesterase
MGKRSAGSPRTGMFESIDSTRGKTRPTERSTVTGEDVLADDVEPHVTQRTCLPSAAFLRRRGSSTVAKEQRVLFISLPCADYPMPISLLILSDIHFGRLSCSNDFALPPNNPNEFQNAVSMKASLIEKAANSAVDAIVVTGDLTSVASPAEFIGAVQAVDEIRNGCGVAPENVFFTFGNHDTNWRICRLGDDTPAFPSDAEYSRVGAEIGNLFAPNVACANRGPIPGSGLFQRELFELIVLNTGYYCTNDQAVKHGRLGAEQLAWVTAVLAQPGDRNKWRIVVLHHHPFNLPYPMPGLDISTLEEGPELCAMMAASGVDFVVHGHRHHPVLTTELRPGWASPISFLCAGSVAVSANHRYGGEIPNLFHIVVLEGRGPHNAATGVVKSFAYSAFTGWTPVARRAAVPLDGEQRFGSCATSGEQRQEVVNSAQAALNASADMFVPLPEYGHLPLAIRCMGIDELCDVLASVAIDLNCNVVGAYPAPVYLRRKA